MSHFMDCEPNFKVMSHIFAPNRGNWQNPNRFELCDKLKFLREDEVYFDFCFEKKNSGEISTPESG